MYSVNDADLVDLEAVSMVDEPWEAVKVSLHLVRYSRYMVMVHPWRPEMGALRYHRGTLHIPNK